MALPSHSQSSIFSSSSFSYGFTYDVFLSFRGSDTRYDFTGNLYRALCDKGIHTFIDDRELQGGDEITPSLCKAIEESRIFIPILSINYASSSFCLDELVHIIHCFKENGRLVLPIFYDVEPSDVRHHKGSYGKALDDHIVKFQNNKDSMERLQKWKSALTQTANFSGHHISPRNGYEYEFIEKIVKYLSSKINRVPLYVADYPVGLEPRVLKVNSFLDVGSTGVVHMLGIYGTGGMGKTTLARAVYNSIADQFDGLCFLNDIRENSSKYGLENLQEKLLSKLVELDVKLGDVNEGISIIKQRLHRKKVLLILDDVHELKQLQVLAGGHDWFGPGSRVIITTRDKILLAGHGIERAYEIDNLNEKEALELLRWNAFKNNKVAPNFNDVLHRAVTYASGLPLAIEVVGSNLFGKNTREWKSALNQYERIPEVWGEITEVSSISHSVSDVSQTRKVFQVIMLISLGVFQAEMTWRVIGFMSCIVGLLCYALSPSFNRLFGRWYPFKVFLYVALSLAILTIIIFAKQARPSTRHVQLRKTFITFVVLMIISVYSFFYDRAMKGKPNMLSVISNAAFALVSVSLHRLLKFGVEMGVFSYFVGCFTIQLLTINWVLNFFAIIFGFLLFLLHSTMNPEPNMASGRQDNQV